MSDHSRRSHKTADQARHGARTVTENKKHKIYLEPSGQLAGGYFAQKSRINSYTFDRKTDPNDPWVKSYSQAECADIMDDMRRLGYACKAVPAFALTKSY